MAYRVVIQPQAESDILSAYRYIVGQGAPEAAGRWYSGIKAEILSLESMPERGTVSPEADRLGFELRQVHFGKRSGVYRIVYRILRDLSEVHVLAVRHGARDEFQIEDLG